MRLKSNFFSKRSVLVYTGVFSVCAFITAAATYIYSPAFSSHAGETVSYSASINSVIGLSLDKSALDLTVMPTSNGSYVFGSIVATVDTNSTGGYDVYFSADSADTRMAHTNNAIDATIDSDFEGAKTSLELPVNSWGYSTDGANYYKIPTLANHALLKTMNSLPLSTEERQAGAQIGVKIDTTLPSGTYTKKVVFSAVAHEAPTPETMQAFTCSELEEIGDSKTLLDVRDNKMYTVKKLDDGNCWMTDSLDISNISISSEDSNLPSGATFTIPGTNLESDDFTDLNQNEVYRDIIYGTHYSFYTATAGWGTSEETSGDSPRDICPKGWRLPTGAAGGDFDELLGGANARQIATELGLRYSGNTYQGAYIDGGVSGDYWSATASSEDEAYHFGYNSSLILTDSTYDKAAGFAIRCVAK